MDACMMHMVAALVYILGGVTSVTFQDFITLEINNRTYLLSEDTANNKSATSNCSKVGLDLLLFNDDEEYFAVSTYVDDYLSDNSILIDGILINLNVTYSSTNKSVRWRNEAIGTGVWAVGEPSNNCKDDNTLKCCAKMDWINYQFRNLQDVGCSTTTLNYICAPRYECSDGTNQCSQNCVERIDGYDCVCNSGYVLGNDTRSCEDVDECKNNSNGCDQRCNNTAGSYVCACQSGYQLSSNGRSCDDVDECTYVSKPCDQTCTNRNGSYVCSCGAGYVLAGDNKTCVNINECLQATPPCQHVCTDTEGSFICSCHTGYDLAGDNKTCVNINECLQATPPCQHVCTDTEGSFICSCHAGYELAQNNKTCANINECLQTKSPCQQECTDTKGSFICSCHVGYSLQNDGTSCTDVNECDVSPDLCQRACINTNGSYNCCSTNYTTNVNTSQCADGSDCSSRRCLGTCTNTEGSYVCGCLSGYAFKQGICSDIDECLPGYALKQGICADIDECASNSTNNCSRACQNGNHSCSRDPGEMDQVCVNIDGSYKCKCPKGFYLRPGNSFCYDVNECELKPPTCDQYCVNTIGSFFCTCRDSLTLQADRTSCSQKLSNKCPCSCLDTKNIAQTTLNNIVNAIKTDLTINRTNTTLYRITKISLPDFRLSSQAIGCCGLIFICIFLSCVVLSDIITRFRLPLSLYKTVSKRVEQNISRENVQS